MIPCPHRPPCPGCPRYGASDIAAPARAALDSLCSELGVPGFRVESADPVAFRHRARLAVRGRAASPKVGLFELGSHRIVDIPRCVIHHPLVNDVAGELRRAIVATHSAPYSDEPHRGLVRYLQVVVERSSGTAQVVVVTNDATHESAMPLLTALQERLGPRLHSLFWNGNPDRTNTILGSHFRQVSGPPAVEERIGGARVFYPPGAFGQSHLVLADRIVALVHGWVPEGARVLELYAGVGAIGLGLVPRSERVTFVETSGDSVCGLELGIDALAPAERARTRVISARAEATCDAVPGQDVVIADPPRKGLESAVRAAVIGTPPARLLYVACGLPAFLDDARALVASGRFSLAELVCFDLFPFTDHVEVAARFDRRSV